MSAETMTTSVSRCPHLLSCFQGPLKCLHKSFCLPLGCRMIRRTSRMLDSFSKASMLQTPQLYIEAHCLTLVFLGRSCLANKDLSTSNVFQVVCSSWEQPQATGCLAIRPLNGFFLFAASFPYFFFFIVY